MPWLLLAWSCGALAIAFSRVPYDDEWFSLELALHTTPSQFWAALADDVHPPWLALLDRGVAQLWSLPIALHALRIAAAVAAIALLARALAPRLALPRWAFVVAAAHPIVWFYAGAARWYPFLLLAHALRCFAIWQPHRTAAHRSRAAAFIAGSALGSVASYIDPLFVIHDAVWLYARRSSRDRFRGAGVLIAAAGCVALVRWASPLHGGTHELLFRPEPRLIAERFATWAVLGVVGEAGLPWPWACSGLICVVSTAWAVIAALRAPALREPALWITSYAVCWLFACCFGVWHPRYSLMLWVLLPALVIKLALSAGPLLRVVCALSAAQLAVVLVLTCAGRGMFKADLNGLRARDCRIVDGARDAPLVVVPYARLAALVARECRLQAPILTVPSVRLLPDEHAQLAQFRTRAAHSPSVWLLATQASSSLQVTNARVRAWLGTRCVPALSRDFGEVPHAWLHPGRSPDYRRYTLQRWDCAARSP